MARTVKRGAGTDEEILADWDTGEYSRSHGGSKTQSDLAYKHKVSVAKINKLIKGREPLNYRIVNNLVEAKQSLAEQNEINVNAVEKIVDERTKHIQFFNNGTITNLSKMLNKIGDETSIMEHRIAQSALKDGRETVLGKQPETQVNVQNNLITKIERVIVKQ